jgi:hypothetical protein
MQTVKESIMIMSNIQEVYQEYIRMRQNGSEPKEVLRTLNTLIEPLSIVDKETLAQKMRAWERDNPDTPTTDLVQSVPPPPEKPVTRELVWVECPNCQKKNRMNEVFCYYCGHMLIESKSQSTKHFADTTDSLFTEEYFGEDSVLILTVRDSKQQFSVRPQLRRHELVIGRVAGNGMMAPDIDLTHIDGMTFGVSRLHLAIRYDSQFNTLQIYDLGSANGSYINGQRLHPKELRVLRDGDELRLGRLVFLVEYRHPGD